MFPRILRSPEIPSEQSGGGGASGRRGARLPSLSTEMAGERTKILQLLAFQPAAAEKLSQLLAGNKDVADEALAITRGALAGSGEDSAYLARTIECFHRYVFELRGSISAHASCMEKLKGAALFANPIGIFGDRDFRVDTPNRQELRERYGEDLDARLRESTQAEETTESGPGAKRKRGATDRFRLIGDSSAQVMTAPPFHLWFLEKPQIQGHLCGWRSVSKFLEAYNPELLARVQEQIAGRETAVAEAAQELGLDGKAPPEPVKLRKISLKSDEMDPGARGGKYSVVIDQRKALAEALRAEIQEGLEILEMMRYSDTVLTPGGRTFSVAAQSRGHLLTWLSRELSTEAARRLAPEWVVDDYDAIRSGGLSTLPREEIEACLTRLAAYRARCTFVRKDAVFSGLASDLKYLKDLEARAAEGKVSVEVQVVLSNAGRAAAIVRAVSAITDSAAPEIARAQVAPVKEACAALYRFREQMCRQALKPIEGEFREALELFQPLFHQTPGVWREDCRSPSVPMERLRETAAGSCFGQHDFRALKEAFELLTCAPRRSGDGENGEAFFRSKNIQDFVEMSRGVVAAYRKWKLLASAAQEQGLINLSPSEGIVQITDFHATNPSRQIYPVRFKGAFKTAEEYAEAHGGLTPAEVVKRSEWLAAEPARLGQGRHTAVRVKVAAVKQFAEAGLYRDSDAKDEPLAALYAEAIKLIPASEAAAELRVVNKLRSCVVLLQKPSAYNEPYLMPEKLAELCAYASISEPVFVAEEKLKALTSEAQRKVLPQLIWAAQEGHYDPAREERFGYYSHMHFTDGAFAPARGGLRQLQMKVWSDFAEMADGATKLEAPVLAESRAPDAPIGEVLVPSVQRATLPAPTVRLTFLEPEKLIRGITFAVHDFQRVDSVFAQQALLLCERTGAEFLRQIGLSEGSYEAFQLLKRRRTTSLIRDTSFSATQHWVAKKFVAAVEAEYAKLKPHLPQDRRAEERGSANPGDGTWQGKALHGKTLAEIAQVPNAAELFPKL